MAVQLAAAGGGVLRGADDASGALILQQVDQVAGWFNLNRFTGIYNTAPANHVFDGSFLNSPKSIDPTNGVGTTSYAEVPHGPQPNGVFLATAVFGFDSEPQPFFGPSPDLASETFAGFRRPHCARSVAAVERRRRTNRRTQSRASQEKGAHHAVVSAPARRHAG
ncbi:hypothetical protein [Accumulibacter sp.]|uniref:Uncharacterized protein n=1 Tax=Accumulibacter regalis TaxID=522306 RepID=C7RVK4_ACCRE|nr:hypothetical protein [Accumulibacter sp.]MBN8498017.1 hypothetical protein [Accumulibacter sp.]MBO3716433.1 hypothetical protein [Accumulibacter sp.]